MLKINRKTAIRITFGFVIMVIGLFTVQMAAETPPAGSTIVVKGVSTIPVTFDGHVSKFEYGDATHMTFQNGHGMVDVYIKCTDGYVYFAFELPDLTPFYGDDIVIMLDTKSTRAEAPDASDIRAYIRRKSENSRMHQGDGKTWVNLYGDWEYHSQPYSTGWEVEARIPLKTLAVDFTRPVSMGFAMRIWDNEPQKIWNWPVGSNEDKPNTWGTLVFQPAK